jgi:ketosteroid isomerase-like protein
MATAAAVTTETTLAQHVQALMSRDLDSIMEHYTEESVVFSPNGVSKGMANIRAFFAGALQLLSPEAMGNMKVIRQDFDGEYAYVLWSALPVLAFANDTFHIRDGKIVAQAFSTPMGS